MVKQRDFRKKRQKYQKANNLWYNIYKKKVNN